MLTSMKKFISVVSVTLCILIAFTLPTQVSAQNLVLNEETLMAGNPQESSPYKVGNIISEDISKRDEYSKQFRLDDGSYMAVSYEQPVHFKNEQGEWIDYNNTLVTQTESSATNDEITSEEYTNKCSDIKVNYSQKSKENNMIKIKAEDYQVSWGYKNTNSVRANVIINQEKLEGNERYTTLKNLTSEISYNNIYDNVDIQYITSSIGIKENIILKNSNAQSDFTIQYKINSLTAKAVNDKVIELCDKSGAVVYLIEAPFMIDADGKTSTQLSLSIVEQKSSKLTLNLSADKKFLSECKYPVTIDPTFTTDQDWQTSECSFVDSSHPNTAYGYESSTGYTGTVCVGTFGQGMYRSYLKMKSLPTLNKGDMVVGAYLNMHLYQNDFYDDMNVSAYYVSENWSQSTVTWNNKPAFESDVVDYEIFTANDSDVWHDWDVTKCVKRWYNGETNNGIMLKAPNESTVAQCAAFYSSNYPASSIPRPLFSIIYRNNKGLEDYWSYSSFSVGTAGTAYVNDYSGNLVFVTSDASTASGYSPATIQHIYNGYMANQKYKKTAPYLGHGWKLNIQQTLLSSDEYGLTGDAKTNYPYVYTDEDGTEHYFYKKTKDGSTKYLDEDGLGLELTINSNNSEKYVISDDKDNKIKFNSNGLLTSTVDSNGNKIQVNYNSDGTTINSVTDGSGNKINLTPNQSSNSLSYVSDPSGRKTICYYSDGKLSQVKNPNGTIVKFTYDSDGALSTVTDVDGYKVEFTYTSAKSGKKVSSIKETGKNGTAGQKITFDRTKYNTTTINTYGADGVSGTVDDLTSTYQFDEFGRTVSVKSKTTNRDLGASVYRYTDGVKDSTASNIKQLNRVSTEYSTGSNSVNLVGNSNMETSGTWIASAWSGTNEFTNTYTEEEQYFGKRSMKINVSAYENTSKGRVYQDISSAVLVPGNTYTLSGYIKTKDVTNGSVTNAGAFICAESFNTDGTSTPFYSEFVTGNTSTAVDNGWQRVSITFKVPSNSGKTRINLALKQSTGSAYFDGIQLEKYGVANNYNMLENSGLENYSSNGLPTGWTDAFTTLDTTTDKLSEGHQEGSYSFRIKGEHDKSKSLYQQVNVKGSENDTYIVSGWVKANAVPKNDGDTRKFKISIMVRYSDGTYKYKTPAEFNYSVSDWQYTSTAFTLSDETSANKTPTAVRIYLSYQNQGNYAYFDNICLVKDNAQSYTYDDDGKLISVVDNSEEKSTMEYTNSDLTKNIDAKGYAYEYKYDSKHNMTQAKSQNGVTYNYTYNNKGLATALEVKATNCKTLKSEVTYNSNGLLATSKDQDGNSVTYNYNNQTGTLTSVTDDSGTTEYSYDANTNQVTSVSKYDEYDDTEYSVDYEYSEDAKQLKKISRNSTEYNIEYDEFGNKTDSKVGTQSLAGYIYNSNNGALISSTYGTGQKVGYTYDEYGNVATKKYNGATAFAWYADRGGNIIKEKDYNNKVEYDISYDSTGRLVRKTAEKTDGTSGLNNSWYTLEYSYDLNNNITRLANLTPLRNTISKYTYGKDNLLTKYEINSGKTVTYTYDGLNRLTGTSLSTTTPINTTYNYYDSNRGSTYTTTKLKSETIDGETYTYSYDTQGNITDIHSSARGSLYSYEYDAMNQLVSVEDHKNSKMYMYTYDAGGNLIAENICDIGSNGAPINTQHKAYEYGDSNWKDKLTSYDGQEITYDAIGNPLTYRDGMSMTWKNGRQLATLNNDAHTVSYGYDSNSVRISKTVDGVKHTYEYINGMLVCETRGEAKFWYSYDANGTLYNVKYTLTDDSTTYSYFYTHNSRGDIVGIYSGSGVLTAHYEYDAWGNVLEVTDKNGNAITSTTHIGNLNPFRYRGYYYDTESGLYYLMSRYYDPVTHRFINADGYFQAGGDILDANMSAYCRNNPISFTDPSGKFIITLTTLATIAEVVMYSILAIVLVKTITTIVTNPAVQQGISDAVNSVSSAFSNSDDDSYSASKDIAVPTEPKNQAYFTVNPHEFTPNGLVMKEYPGTKNGRIIEWRDPISQAKIFEWNEDLKNGSHYHAMMIEWDGNHSGTHYLPGTPVPEPWNSMYFGG